MSRGVLMGAVAQRRATSVPGSIRPRSVRLRGRRRVRHVGPARWQAPPGSPTVPVVMLLTEVQGVDHLRPGEIGEHDLFGT
jgi:hypothetical protein